MDIKKQLSDIIDIYKKATFSVFTRSGLIMTFVLLIAFFSFYLFNFTLTLPPPQKAVPIFHFDIIAVLVAMISAILTMALWWILGTRYAPKIGALLTEKKIANILFTKGDIHYFEKVDRESLRIMPGTIIAKFINLLLSWFAVTAFLLGFLLPYFAGAESSDRLYTFFTVDLNDLVGYLLKLLIVFVLSPLLMTITVPIPWMLLDTRLKAYNSGAKINSFVGRAIQARVNSLFAIGGIVTLVMQNLSPDTVILVIVFIICYLAFPAMIMVTLYNMLFQVKYYESFLAEIPVPFGVTKVEMELKFKKQSTLEEPVSQSEEPINDSKQD